MPESKDDLLIYPLTPDSKDFYYKISGILNNCQDTEDLTREMPDLNSPDQILGFLLAILTQVLIKYRSSNNSNQN